MHNLWLLTLHGELGLSPKAMEGAKRVLDAGTGRYSPCRPPLYSYHVDGRLGTGIWAEEYGMYDPGAFPRRRMDYTDRPSPADMHPESEVGNLVPLHLSKMGV